MKQFFELLVVFSVVCAGLFAYGYFLGMTGARKKMAQELVSMYIYAGAEGSKARVEVKEAIKMVLDEFTFFKAKTSAVWSWTHNTISKL